MSISINEVNSQLGTILAEADVKLRELIFAAARTIAEVKGNVYSLSVKLEGDAVAEISHFKSSITVGGSSVPTGDISVLSQIARNISQAEGVAFGFFRKVESEVEHVVEEVVQEFKQAPQPVPVEVPPAAA